MARYQSFRRKEPPKPSSKTNPDALRSRPFAPVPKSQEIAPASPKQESQPANFLVLTPDGGRSLPVQAKLTIGAPNDPYEQEADRVAAQVVQQINAPQANQPQAVQRDALPEEEELQLKPVVQREVLPEEELQMKPAPTAGILEGDAPPDVEAAITRVRGRGQALAPDLQAQMGQAMGADFSGVRVHTDSQSDQLNSSIQAKAFTTGQDVFFRQGAYQPRSQGGQELIAHELTHVVQQDNHGNVQLVQRRLAANAPIDAAAAAQVTKVENPHGFVFILDDENSGESVVVKLEQVDTQNESMSSFDARYELGEEIGSAVFGNNAITKAIVKPGELANLQSLSAIPNKGGKLAATMSNQTLLKEHYAIKMPKVALGNNLFDLSIENRPGKTRDGMDTDTIKNLILGNGNSMGKMAYYDALVRNYDRFNAVDSTVAIKNIDYAIAMDKTIPLDNIFNQRTLINPRSDQQSNEMTELRGNNRREYATKLLENMWMNAFMVTIPEKDRLEKLTKDNWKSYIACIGAMVKGMNEAEQAVGLKMQQWSQDVQQKTQHGQNKNIEQQETKRILVNRYLVGLGQKAPARPEKKPCTL